MGVDREVVWSREDADAAAQGGAVVSSTSMRPGAPRGEPPFVGRATELAALHDALEEVARGHAPVIVSIQGDPGIGKSALAAHFGAGVAPDGALVLAGRCPEHGSLPYGALAGVVDSLASAMQRMPKEEALAATPRYASLLLRLFPALARVDALRMASGVRSVSGDPLEQRRRAFGALREVLARIAASRPVVLVIDDAQWSDPDGAPLLRAALSLPDPPPLLVVLTSSGAAASTREWPAPKRTLTLAPLDVPASCELARALLGDGDEALVASLVRETHGNPLLLTELARHSMARLPGAPAPASLEDAVDGTLRGLPPEARAVLELAIVAGAPLSVRTLERATRLSPGEVERVVGSLRVARLVRTDRAVDLDLVEPTSGGVRDVVLARLSAPGARARHAALAAALEEEPGGDPGAVARHHEAAGDGARAIALWERAAARASEALAFESAAVLYRRILELDVDAPPESKRVLQRKLADALVGSGRGKEAAAAYVEAARGASVAEQMDLERLAAAHLMRSGHIDEGLALLRRILADVGLAMPTRSVTGLLLFLWNRLVLRVRGYRFVWRDESDVPRSTLTLVDALSASSESSALLESVASAGLNARYVRAALAAGEPRRVVRALLAEATCLSMIGRQTESQVDRALDAATKVIERLGDPVLRALRSGVLALVQYQRGHFHEAIPAIDGAIEELRATGKGLSFELTLLHVFRLFSFTWVGPYTELIPAYEQVIRDADDRGDLWAGCLARLGCAPAAFMWGEPGEARRVLDAAIAPWRKHPFGLPHFLHLHGLVEAMLVEGRPAGALAMLEASSDEVRASFLLRSQMLRVLHVRNTARALLATPNPAHEPRVRVCIRRLLRERVGYATAFGLVFEAILVLRSGRREEAFAALAKAEEALGAQKLRAWQAAAALVRGRLQGGDEGARLVAASEDDLRAIGIHRPEVALAAAGFGPVADAERGPMLAPQ